MARQIVRNRVYDKDYFSGSQAALYIGDVFVDEVVSYAFRVSQTKTPIYGYGSQLFDAVSKGPVLVSGNFAINFKESAYLYLVLMRYQEIVRGVETVLKKVTKGSLTPDPRSLINTITDHERQARLVPAPFKFKTRPNHGNIVRSSIERVIQGNITTREKHDFLQSLAGFASQRGLDATFEDYADAFEDVLWESDTSNLDELVTRTDDSFFNGFDVYFTYGDYNNPKANHTVERITGIHLTGSEKRVNISGEPIIESYDFFARNSY